MEPVDLSQTAAMDRSGEEYPLITWHLLEEFQFMCSAAEWGLWSL